ncbi:MAG: OmpA family protein [Bacteroidales bacterium]|nr:OmpA family protein [Bacteroidales bacterium]
MRKLSSLLLILFFTLNIFAQSNIPIFIEENFDNNENDWVVEDDSEADSEIINGYYFIYNKSTDYAYRFWNSFDVDDTKDFIIEVKIRQVYGDDNQGYGIMFASTGVENNYNFEITSTGYYRNSNQFDGEYDDNDWVKTPHIKPMNEYNILKVKKNNGYLYYYINGKMVDAVKYEGALGDDIGFILRTKMKAQVDYLKIYAEKPVINIVENPISNPKENLGSNVNTSYSELIPVIAPDGKTIYFVRDDYPGNVGDDKDHNDIWYTKVSGDNWSKAKNMGRPLNNEGHNFVICVTPDNNSLILNGTYTAFGEDGGNGISISNQLKDGSWSIPKEIEIDNFYNDDDYQNFTFSSDLQVIIMSLERSDDTKGESDLYVSFRKSDGTYTEPKNLGDDVNTFTEEGTPFLAADGKTLYFYSEGHRGYGSADVFVSKRLDNSWTKWSTPLNLGPNINTERWDAYFTLDAKGEYAYFVSSYNSIGEEDIFRVKLQEELQPDPVVLIYGKVYDNKTKKPLSSQILYDDLQTNKEVGIATSNAGTGEYKIILPYGKNYGFFAKKSGYMALSDNIDLTDIQEYTEIERDLYLVPIEVNQQIVLNNVFFQKGKADLYSSSYPELDRLVDIMNENPEIKIEVQGHSNNLGDRDKLMELSEQRAESVKKYIVEKGVSPDRITTVGFGPDKPIATNDTEAGRKKNQRVEFKITDK